MQLFSSRRASFRPTSSLASDAHTVGDTKPASADAPHDACARLRPTPPQARSAWMRCVQSWSAAAAPHVDLADLQTQPIWQAVGHAGTMPAQAPARLCHLDIERVLHWFERPLPRRIGAFAQGEQPKAQFVARLRQAPVPAICRPPRAPNWPRVRRTSPTAAEAFAVAGLAQGHVALCVDILVPPEAPGVPMWSQILGAPKAGILPPAESVQALMWQLSVRAAHREQAYLPALSHLLQFVFEAVTGAPKLAASERAYALWEHTPPDVAAPAIPVVSWAQACLHFDFEAEEGPHVRRAQAAIVRSFRHAMAQWLAVRVPKLKWTAKTSVQQFGQQVDALWAAFVGGIFVPTAADQMCQDYYGRVTWTSRVGNRFSLFCVRRNMWRGAKHIEAFIHARVADDIITPLQRGEMAPRRLMFAQVRRELQDWRRFGRADARDGIGPKTQGKLLAQAIVQAEAASNFPPCASGDGD